MYDEQNDEQNDETAQSAPTKPVLGPYDGGEITLPNGFIFGDEWIRTAELREMTGADERILLDKKANRDGAVTERILSACLTRLGSETNAKKIATMVPHIAVTDATFLLVRLRQLSLGGEVSYKAMCRKCDEERDYTYDFATCEYSSRADGDTLPSPFEGVTPRGTPFKYRLLRVGQQPKLAEYKRQNPDGVLNALLYLQVVELNGKKLVSPRDVDDLSTRLMNEIRKVIDDSDLGLDMEVINECPVCGEHSKTMIPIADERFFFPSGIRSR